MSAVSETVTHFLENYTPEEIRLIRVVFTNTQIRDWVSVETGYDLTEEEALAILDMVAMSFEEGEE